MIIATNINYLTSFCKKKEPRVEPRVEPRAEPQDWIQTKNISAN